MPTAQNPADCASRGFWWTGLDYLKEPEKLWSTVDSISSAEDEKNEHVETKIITLVLTDTMTKCLLLYQLENWPNILRLTCYWLRVRDRLKRKAIPDAGVSPSTEEIDKAM